MVFKAFGDFEDSMFLEILEKVKVDVDRFKVDV